MKFIFHLSIVNFYFLSFLVDEVRLIDLDDRTKESTPSSILKSPHAFELDCGKHSINDRKQKLSF